MNKKLINNMSIGILVNNHDKRKFFEVSRFMCSFKRIVLLSCIVISFLFVAISCNAAKSMKVPANMISGSSVTKGRIFYTPSIPENTLAGIRLGRSATEVLMKWGNPTKIDPTDTFAVADNSGKSFSSSDKKGAEVEKSDYELKIPGAVAPNSAPSAGFLPPLAGTPTSDNKNVQNIPQEPVVDEITWTYDLPNGITLEFIITDGLVTQITVGGQGPWSLSKTRTGMQLGDTYKLALFVCGYPESHKYEGNFLRLSYINKVHAMYTFLNRKLVGITIAMVPQTLN